MDSGARIVSAMQTAALRANLPVPTEAAVKDIIGISLLPAMQILFGKLPAEEQQLLFEYYKQEYVENDKTPTPMFEGAFSLLENLSGQGRLLAVATGKARRGLNRVWQQTSTGHFFHASRCGDEAESKPSSDMLSQLLDELRVSAEEAVMIGDTVYDMQMAEQLGMDRIAVSHGVHESERLAQHQPLIIVDSLVQLQTYLS